MDNTNQATETTNPTPSTFAVIDGGLSGPTESAIKAASEKEIPTEARAKDLFNMVETMQSLKTFAHDIADQRKKVLGEEAEISAILEERLEDISMETLKTLSDARIEELFTGPDGRAIQLATNDTDPRTEAEFKRAFLVFMKESSEALQQIDEQTAKLELEIEASREEVNELMKNFGSYNNYIRQTLQQRLATLPEGPERDNCINIQAAMEDAYDLNRIYDTVSKLDRANIIDDFKSQTRSVRLYEKYKKHLTTMGITTDLTDFNNLEQHLDEKYHALSNLFLFSVIKLFAYKKEVTRYDGVFISQLSVNIRDLMGKTQNDPANTERFKVSIQRVLDLFL